ncbi:MAG: PASTA domain-containing protein, partial [Rhizobacter sp.]
DKPITDDCPGKVIATVPPPDQPLPKGSAVSVTVGVLASGPDTCKSGFVWRDAFPGDHVCVAPAVRAQAQAENAQGPAHRALPVFGLPFGPDTCAPGFVWRDARQGDHVCVSGASRQAAADENRQAASRLACTH